MNSPINGKYAGYCGAKNDKIIFSEEINMSNLLKSIDILLVTNPTNIRYLTGFVGVAGNEREAYLLITKTQAFLLTNSLYLEQAKKSSLLQCYTDTWLNTKKPVQVVEISRENSLEKKLNWILKGLNPLRPKGLTLNSLCLGFEENDLKVSEYRNLQIKLKGVKLIPTQNRIEKLRMIKRSDEINNIRAAAKLTDECFPLIVKMLKPGITESEIAWEIESCFRKHGTEPAFSPIVAFGKNTSQPHYSLTNNSQLTTNNLVLLDFGARVNGYCADMTRVVFIGKPKPEWLRAYKAVFTNNSFSQYI